MFVNRSASKAWKVALFEIERYVTDGERALPEDSVVQMKMKIQKSGVSGADVTVYVFTSVGLSRGF